jgi:hypothetical protein
MPNERANGGSGAPFATIKKSVWVNDWQAHATTA